MEYELGKQLEIINYKLDAILEVIEIETQKQEENNETTKITQKKDQNY